MVLVFDALSEIPQAAGTMQNLYLADSNSDMSVLQQYAEDWCSYIDCRFCNTTAPVRFCRQSSETTAIVNSQALQVFQHRCENADHTHMTGLRFVSIAGFATQLS